MTRTMPSYFGGFIENLDSSGRELVVVNADESDEHVARIREYFDRYNFALSTAFDDGALPDSFLLLTDGERCLAAIDIDTLYDYLIHPLESGSFIDRYVEDPNVFEAIQAFLVNLDENVYKVEGEGKIPLIEVSRVIEQQAGRNTTGTLHSGFQRLSRLRDTRETWDTYVRIADRGVAVNLYGIPDWRPPSTEPMTIFADEDGDHVGEFWFVVYQGDDAEVGGALVAREVEPSVYTGFWTFDSEYVSGIVEYVETDLQPRLERLDET